ncbi:response regulator transcription factor [Candidatus Kaiserbacteria bacterium]|nr:response regulator transcription factor [Candidatus Kaiserbacteria bacterium]
MNKRHSPVRILIVDDHPSVREGLALRISLDSDLEVCGEAESEDQALELVKQTSPELVLVDISLKSGHGIELIKRIRSLDPAIKMLVITGFQESLYAERAFRAGALGYLNKQESNEKMIEAIRTVLAGERFISPEISRRLINQALGASDVTKTPIERLTDRELEIFRMIGEGLTTSAIANRLFLSTHTIDTHRENIKRKLGAKNAGELNRQAVQWLLENG